MPCNFNAGSVVYLRLQHTALAHYTNTADSAHTHQESTQQSPCRPTLCISSWEGWVWPWDESWWLAVTLSGVMNWATLQCFAPVGVTSPYAWDGCDGTCVRVCRRVVVCIPCGYERVGVLIQVSYFRVYVHMCPLLCHARLTSFLKRAGSSPMVVLTRLTISW